MDEVVKMRICFISDTHTYHKSVTIPECDILIHSGDATHRGRKEEMEAFGLWFRTLPVAHKIFVPGNHDISTEKEPENALKWLGFDSLDKVGETYYLHRNWIIVNGLVIYGDGAQPSFGYGWAHNVDRGAPIAAVWEKIVDNTNILVTHGPAEGILDYIPDQGVGVGCADLTKRIFQLKDLFIHACGHIHEGYNTKEVLDKLFINASICTARYDPTNDPILVDVWLNDSGKWVSEVVY